jgi:hypothetical protein
MSSETITVTVSVEPALVHAVNVLLLMGIGFFLCMILLIVLLVMEKKFGGDRLKAE